MRRQVELEAEHFAPIGLPLTISEATARVAADDIDLLVDLDGWTFGARQELFALRPARLQCTGVDFAGSTGGQYMDFRLTSRANAPPSSSHLFTERLAYHPGYESPHEYKESHAGVVTAFEMAPAVRDSERARWGGFVRVVYVT